MAKNQNQKDDLAERVTALEEKLAALEGGAAPVADDAVLASADLALLIDALRPLGVHAPPEGLLVRWLAQWRREEILAAIDRAVRTWYGQATAPGAPATSPGADWREIAALYDVLLQVQLSPVVELNRAVAVAMRDGPAVGVKLIDGLLARGELRDYHPAHAARAELCRRSGQLRAAKASYVRAIALARQGPERRFLEHQLSRLTA